MDKYKYFQIKRLSFQASEHSLGWGRLLALRGSLLQTRGCQQTARCPFLLLRRVYFLYISTVPDTMQCYFNSCLDTSLNLEMHTEGGWAITTK